MKEGGGRGEEKDVGGERDGSSAKHQRDRFGTLDMRDSPP